MEVFFTTYPILTTFWFFIFGTIIGSFLNVVILRHESEEKLTGRSHCPKCNHALAWHELIPILSYLIQGGKCRGCAERISPQYPLVEFVTGILFAIVFLVVYSPSLTTNHFSLLTLVELVLHLAIWSLLVVITVYDLRTKLIPNVFSYSFSVLALLVTLLVSLTTNHFSLITLLSGPLLFLPFYLLWKFSDGKWMGLGDGKLALGIGWLFGFEHGGSAIILAFWFGAAVALALMAVQRLTASLYRRQHPFLSTFKRLASQDLSLKSEIPFGPFMVLGALYVYIFGWSIVSFIY